MENLYVIIKYIYMQFSRKFRKSRTEAAKNEL